MIRIPHFTEQEIQYYINRYSKDFIDYNNFNKRPKEQSTLEDYTE